MATNLLGEQYSAAQVHELIMQYFRYGTLLADIGYLDYDKHIATFLSMDNQLKKEYA